MPWDLKTHLKVFSKNEKGQMILLSGLIIVIGLITYTSLLNEMIFTTNTPQTGQDLSKNDVKQLRTLIVGQAQVASNYALYKNATEGGDVADAYMTFMNPLVDAASVYYVSHGVSIDIKLNSINNTNDTASLLPSTLFVRDNMGPHTFANQSIIIPMDYRQANIMPVYGMIWNITHDFGIPVYQILQDPRGEAWDLENNKSESYTDFDITIKTNDTTFDNSSIGNNTVTDRDYAGGPYAIDATNLNATIEERLEGFNNGTAMLTFDTYLDFDFRYNIADGTDYVIRFTMSDGSWKNISLSFVTNTNPVTSITSSGAGDAEYLQFGVDGAKINNNYMFYSQTTYWTQLLQDVFIANSNFTNSITITRITVWWEHDVNKQKLNYIHMNHKGVWSTPTSYVYKTSGQVVDINPDLELFHPPNITMHRIWKEFAYDKTAVIDSAPRIGVWPPLGQYESRLSMMTAYYMHSGVQYHELNNTIISQTDYINKSGGLYNYDIVTIPHSDIRGAWDGSGKEAIKKIVMWVKDGGVLHVECHGLESMDYAAQNAKEELGDSLLGLDADAWYGFIGVIFSQGMYNSYVEGKPMAFIGKATDTSLAHDSSWKYRYYNNASKPNDPMADSGAVFNPLAQTYTPDGELEITYGHTKAFIIIPDEPDPSEWVDAPEPPCYGGYHSGAYVINNCYPSIKEHNPDINIMAVPINNNLSNINRSTYVSAKFGNGTVIYLGSHDQANDGPQRERQIFNTFFYAVLRERQIFAIRDINFTIRFNNKNTHYNTTIGIESMS